MALDPGLKARIEAWWNTTDGSVRRSSGMVASCWGCGRSAPVRRAIDVAGDPQLVGLVCERDDCGHVAVFLLSRILPLLPKEAP